MSSLRTSFAGRLVITVFVPIDYPSFHILFLFHVSVLYHFVSSANIR